MAAQFLAFDLGAESGRAMLATLEGGELRLAELHRFPNQPIEEHGSLRWNIRALWDEMRHALALAPEGLRGIGVDTWGVDFALVGADGALLENPYHYRDRRTQGAMPRVFEKLSRERIYSITGIQFLPINTLYQLFCCDPARVESAERLLMIPDLLNYWLTGNFCSEYSIASTTQLLEAAARDWSEEMIAALAFPRRLFQPIVRPGTEIGRFGGAPVIAPACHDTASAVAAIAMSAGTAFLSSGTWSLIGAEVREPMITPRARDLNFTNEGGVCGTIRLLKNVAGMWLLQSCRRCWPEISSYDDLLGAATREAPFRSLIEPDDSAFLNPENMPQAIVRYCARTGQPAPQSPAAFTRAILESLALKYRLILEGLEQISGRRFTQIRVVGGGSRNRLLNQFTADATGRAVIAGPVEATALGNVAMQMLGTGAASSLEEARAIVARSFPTERFEPRDADRWEEPFRRFCQLPAP